MVVSYDATFLYVAHDVGDAIALADDIVFFGAVFLSRGPLGDLSFLPTRNPGRGSSGINLEKEAAAALMVVFYLPLYLLGFFLFANSLMDRHINNKFYPERVHKGFYPKK